MAIFPQIFSRIEKRCANAGERNVLRQLKRCLSDDYIIWHDNPVGPLQRRPDFVVFNPRKGVLVLEVKHWDFSNIKMANRMRVMLAQESGPVELQHPLEQARECALQINNVLARDPHLKQTKARYTGRCAVPYGWGAVMSNIRRAQMQDSDLAPLFPAACTLLRDDLDAEVSPEDFEQRLKGLFFDAFFPVDLTLPQQNRVRWHLFPEVRISNLSAAQKATAQQADKFAIPDLVQVMDMNQEQAARALGEGHRVIHGAAGTGKTMIVIFRAQHLAQQAVPGAQPALVLCFSRPLAARIAQQLADRDVSPEKVIVRTFHAWCKDMVRTYHLDDPQGLPQNAYYPALVDTVGRALQDGKIPRGQYSALLIDEGHDFKADWLRIATQLVDPATDSLLLCYDDAQNIYQHKEKGFSWASVGIKASGRTSILRLDFRNTTEILALAMQCAEHLLTEAEETETQMQRVHPATVGQRGPMPQLLRFGCEDEETKALAGRIAALIEAGTPLDDVAVLSYKKSNLEALQKALKPLGVVTQDRGGSDRRRDIDWSQPSVKLLSMHAAKGLEFPYVFIMRLDDMPGQQDPDEELRLLYVAMTRATQQLTLSAAGDSPMVQRVQDALKVISDRLAA